MERRQVWDHSSGIYTPARVYVVRVEGQQQPHRVISVICALVQYCAVSHVHIRTLRYRYARVRIPRPQSVDSRLV